MSKSYWIFCLLFIFVSAEGAAAPMVPTSSLEQKVQQLDSEIRKLWVQRRVNKNNIRELKKSEQDLRNSLKKLESLQAELKTIKGQLMDLNAGVVGLKERINSVEKTNEASANKLESKLENKLDLRLSGIEKGTESSKKSESLQAESFKRITNLENVIASLQKELQQTTANLSAVPEESLSSREIGLYIACFALLLAFLSSVFAFSSTRKSLKRITQVEGNQEKNLEKDSQLLQAVSENSEKFSELIKGLSEKIQSQSTVPVDDESKTDLVKLIADRLTFMEMTLYRMDKQVRGYKQLKKSISQMKDNLAANGYELVDLLGKPYNEGIKATATFVEDENLEPGTQIITGVVKPQINFKGVMIQSAQIVVSQNA